ncbi:hypothetical protein NE237_004403 [Protea cynaroides]|uniref:Uncharacterized protein n=1 Tax=Protea cynaroides TaxID=273540 RepID=A0A9Q0KJD6_9MAGN|nr:hypothetical protein NE237_004403 [Protea cynaroides]
MQPLLPVANHEQFITSTLFHLILVTSPFKTTLVIPSLLQYISSKTLINPPLFLSLDLLHTKTKQTERSSGMSTAYHTSVLLFFLIILLAVLSPPVAFATTPLAQLAAESQNHATLQPKPVHERHVFRGGEIKSCLPKGFRRNSAPSRYANYHIFGSPCASDEHHQNKP